ncbi:MAG: glycosyltransferase [Pseudomonadota bacterium]
MLVFAMAAAFVWVLLLLVWHGFWRADQRLPEAGWQEAEPPPGVLAVIPARDEADSIGAVLSAHAATEYPGSFGVIVVDDNSTDGTGAIARDEAAQSHRPITVLTGGPLPPGWSGKLWAVHQGIERSDEAPEARYVLLTDADIRHAPGTLERLVAFAEARGLALVSLMARLETGQGLGRLLVPAYVFFFQKLYPFPAVNDPHSWHAGAAGGCMLVRREALRSFGGVAAVRDALIDDCALAAELKGTRAGGDRGRRAIWLGLADDEVVSLRDTGALGTIWETVARTAFPQLHRSWALLILCTVGMGFLYLSPPLLFLLAPLHGQWGAAIFGLLGWGLMGRAFWPTLRLYGGAWYHAVALPIAAVVYMLMTLDSARRDLMGRASPWKGRTYSAMARERQD